MQRWDRLDKNQPPSEWARLLKLLGLMLAAAAGFAYYTWFGAAPGGADDAPTATVSPPSVTVTPATGLPAGTAETHLTPRPNTQISVGAVAPTFTLPILGGSQTVNLGQFAGQPVLINFWASWCLPCREEMPALEQAYRANAPRGVVVLGITSREQDTLEDALAFVSEFQATYPQLWDETGGLLQDYGVMNLPMSVFINQDGQIERVQHGALSAAQLDEYLAEFVP